MHEELRDLLMKTARAPRLNVGGKLMRDALVASQRFFRTRTAHYLDQLEFAVSALATVELTEGEQERFDLHVIEQAEINAAKAARVAEHALTDEQREARRKAAAEAEKPAAEPEAKAAEQPTETAELPLEGREA